MGGVFKSSDSISFITSRSEKVKALLPPFYRENRTSFLCHVKQ